MTRELNALATPLQQLMHLTICKIYYSYYQLMTMQELYRPVAVSPPSDLLSLTSDHSSHISSVVGVGIRNDDVDDIGLCCSSTGLQMGPPHVSEDSLSDDVSVFSGSRSPEAKLERQPVPRPLSTLPLHATDEAAAASVVGHGFVVGSDSASPHCGNSAAPSPSQVCSSGSSDFPLAGCIFNTCSQSINQS